MTLKEAYEKAKHKNKYQDRLIIKNLLMGRIKTGRSYNNTDTEEYLVRVLMDMNVTREEICSMTFEQGLTYIYLFGE